MFSLSRLFAFMYVSRFRGFLGLSWSSWLKLVPFALFFVGVILRWPLWVSLAWLLVALLIWAAYLIVGRMGYQRFVADESYRIDAGAAPQAVNQHVALRATGIFSLNDREDYVLQHRAEYWRVPLGQHIFMVNHRPGTFLYQIIKPEYIQEVQPGYLLFGARPKRALALTFLVTWGPQYAEYKLYYVGADNAQPPDQKRTVYLTFENEQDLQQVWHSFTRSVAETAEA